MTRSSGARLSLGSALIFLLGALLRADGLFRPLDQPSWRDCDVAAVARNFFREGMDLTHPRIDWRRDGPGYAEMEFPLFPWLVAWGYRLRGAPEPIFIARLLAWLLSLGTLATFFLLARQWLAPAAARAAELCFALAPLVAGTATSLQPEGLMLWAYLAAPLLFARWLDEPTWGRWCAAAGVIALAVLAKLPAAHLGLLLAGLLWNRWGWSAWRRRDVWLLAVVSLLPAALWYYHAHQLWLEYGNSLGVSNETHWAGADLWRYPHFVSGMVRLELYRVWMPVGVVLAGVGLVATRNALARGLIGCWLTSIGLYYLAAGRTTGDDWADYYHIVAAAPAALLIGLGWEVLWSIACQAACCPLAAGLACAAPLAAGLWGERGRWLPLLALVAAGSALWARSRIDSQRFGSLAGSERAPPRWVALLPGAALVALVALSAQLGARLAARRPPPGPSPLYRCAEAFRPLVAGPGLLIASGGTSVDETGRPVAYDASYFFYWLERFGFTVPLEDQSLETVAELHARGARWFVAERAAVRQAPGFEAALRGRYRQLAACDEAWLFALDEPPPSTHAENPAP